MENKATTISAIAINDATLSEYIGRFIEEGAYHVSDPNIKRNLLHIVSTMPVFSPFILYDALAYQTSAAVVRKCLNRLEKSGYIKTLTIGNKDNEIRTIYYATKQGYNHISSLIPALQEFHGKQGKRLSETGMHDLGVGYTYLAYLTSPFYIEQIGYEDVTKFESSVMPKGKAMLRNVRHDAVLYLSSDHWRGKIYLEHDTGSERLDILAGKLPQYASHHLLEQNDILLFTFRRNNPERPACFKKGNLTRLILNMPDGMTVNDYRQQPSVPDSCLSVLAALEKFTPAFRSHWKKPQLVKMSERINAMNEINLFSYFHAAQDSFAASRRDGILKILLEAFYDERSPYAFAIGCMLSGNRVICSSCSTLPAALSFIHMQDHPETVTWLTRTLSAYYGDITYIDDMKTYPNPLPGKHPLTMRNIFYSSRLHGDLSVEYVSRDISGIMRFFAIINNAYNVHSNNRSCILLVDSFKDAVRIADLTGYLYNISEIPYDRMFAAFLTRGGDHLYMVNSQHKEVRIKVPDA